MELLRRHCTAIAADAARFGTIVATLETRWGREVEGGERAGFPQQVPTFEISQNQGNNNGAAFYSRARHNC